MFWIELKKEKIDIERKDSLFFALDKGRFRRVDIGFSARKFWHIIKEFDSVKKRFVKSEIEEISKIIERDENARYEILFKFLKKKEIPQSQYLKFGECMAYFSFCSLFDKHFSIEETQELYDIWNNFQPK